MIPFGSIDDLSFEHVPPAAVGGRQLVLTCKPCNHRAGGGIDHHWKPADALADFLIGDLREPIKAELHVGESRMAVRLTAIDQQVSMVAAECASDPAAVKAITAALAHVPSVPHGAVLRLELAISQSFSCSPRS